MSRVFLPAPALDADHINTVTAAWLASLAAAAYESEDSLTTAWPDQPKKFIDNPDSHTQAWAGLLPDGETAVIAFRGTEGVAQDWLTDADIRREDNPWLSKKGCLHRGFYDSYQSVADEIIQVLQNFGAVKSVWLCGHSLGGALATLAAAHLKDAEFEIAGICTIGQPRVGDKDFAHDYEQSGLNAKHVRVAHIRDPVTRVPPSIMGWSHLGMRWLLDRKGRRIDRPKWYHYLLDRFTAWFGGSSEKRALTALKSYLAAHSAEGYVSMLEKLAQE